MADLEPNRNILIVDDNEAIHMDFKRVLTSGPNNDTQELESLSADLFGDEMPSSVEVCDYQLQYASQGKEALALLEKNLEQGIRFAVAFVDVRMPPGWDGIETIQHLWEADPWIQVVICTAYADYNWEEIQMELGQGHQYLILKKPFDTMEAQQLALTLSEKWYAERRANLQMDELEEIVAKRTKDLHEANEELRREIADRTKAQMAVKVTSELFRATFEQAAVGIAHLSPDGRFLRLNNRLCDLVGFNTEELQAKSLRDITFRDDLLIDAEYLRDMEARALEHYSVEKRFVHRDGSIVWVALTVSLLWTPQGRPNYFIYIVQDISDRKKAEEAVAEGDKEITRHRMALSATEQKFATVFIMSPLAMAITTIDDGSFLDVNDAFLRLVGLEHSQVIGKTASGLGVFKDPGQWDEIVDEIKKTGHVHQMLAPVMCADGTASERFLTADRIKIGSEDFLLLWMASGLL